MGRFGGFYKGEKKKSKKVLEKKIGGFETPTFKLPEIINRGKKSE